jgi:hypothetical protein
MYVCTVCTVQIVDVDVDVKEGKICERKVLGKLVYQYGKIKQI